MKNKEALLLEMFNSLDDTDKDRVLRQVEDLVKCSKKKSTTKFIPMRIEKEFLQDKQCDYHALGVISLFGINNGNSGRKVITTTQSYINNHLEEVENVSNKTWETTYRALLKIKNSHKGLLSVSKSTNGANVYNVHYSNKDNKGYVLVEENTLKVLLENKNNNLVKTYLLLKLICKDGKKVISRNYLCEGIGLSLRSTANLDKITKMTDLLQEKGLIKKEYVENGKSVRGIMFSVLK